MDRLKLRPDVLIEPVINDWYAWTYLVSPATASMITVDLHYPIIESFLKNPKHHADAQKRMRGGPYLAYGEDRVPQVRAAFEQMKSRTQCFAELCLAIRTLNKTLLAEATGESLEGLYSKIPEILKGKVELFYDENNRPGFRFFEYLLYQIPLYNAGLQGFVFSRTLSDDRAFALSTPRLVDSSTSMKLTVPFASKAIDRVSESRLAPLGIADFDELRESLPASERSPFFNHFFETEAASSPRSNPLENIQGVSVKYLNHATLLIQTPFCSILTDPLLAHIGGSADRFSYADLPEHIDFVLLTHNHQDHVVLETLLQIRHKIGQIIVPRGRAGSLLDPSLKLILQCCGFDNIRDVTEFEDVPIPGGRVRSLPFLGEHGDLAIYSKLAYLVELDGKKIFVGADLNNLQPEMFEQIQRDIGAMDAVFIGMECDGAPMSWLYGPLLLKQVSRREDQSRRLNGCSSGKALALINSLCAKSVFIYAMGAEPWLKFISSIEYTNESLPIVESDLVIAECRRRGIPCERLYMSKTLRL